MRRKHYTGAEVCRMASMWNSGTPTVLIACEFGRTMQAIRSQGHVKRHLFQRRQSGKGRVRINVATAAALRRDGFTLTAIAERFNVSAPAVFYALRRAA